MKKNINVFVWIMALTLLIYSFIKNPSFESLFGFEINIWIYRLFWSIIAILSIIYHFKSSKTKSPKI
jgi:uncharacterized membrane protein